MTKDRLTIMDCIDALHLKEIKRLEKLPFRQSIKLKIHALKTSIKIRSLIRAKKEREADSACNEYNRIMEERLRVLIEEPVVVNKGFDFKDAREMLNGGRATSGE